MPDFPHLAQRLFNTPLAILPGKAEIVMAALMDRLGVAHLFRVGADGQMASVDLAALDLEAEEPAPYRPYQVAGGIAVIPITGTLVHKLGTMRPYSGMTGYDGIRANLSLALADEDVKGIAFDIESGGGEVSGCFDLVDDIFAARGEKPMAAILSECAYSAAFAIASAVDPGRIYVPRTGGTGSVGVISMHVDFSKALEKAGVKVTLLTASARKTDGSEFQELSKEAFDLAMADIEEATVLFCETVARNRKISAAKVRGTQAATFMGGRGGEVGFADKVMSPHDAFADFVQSIS
jgi:ClpP class serine protease